MLESTFLRLPHVGPDFLKIAFISGITVALAAFFAVTAMIWERFTEQGYTGAWPRRFDAAWQALAVLSLAAYLGFGVYGLATASPFTPERLDLTSNEHPFQRLSISFAALSVAVLPEWCRLVLILAITLIMGLLPILESMDPLTPQDFAGTILLLCFDLTCIATASWLVRQSIRLDTTQLTLSIERVASRTQHATNSAQKHINGFIHDHILSVLISVASGLADRRVLASTARKALTMLDRRVPSIKIPSSPQLFYQITQMASGLSPHIVIREHFSEPVALPPNVGTALLVSCAGSPVH